MTTRTKRGCFKPNFTVAEKKRNRMRELAKEILTPHPNWSTVEVVENIEVCAVKLARMVLRG